MAIIASGIANLIGQLRDGAKGMLPLLLLAIYTVLGALLFSSIEGPNEHHMLSEQVIEREELLRRTIYKLNALQIRRQRTRMSAEEEYNATAKTLSHFQETLGVVPVDPNKDIHWTFLGAVFYCMTVYTTIGYGNIVPYTVAGRILTIVYAFIGIPITVISLFCLGSLFARLCKLLWKIFLRSTRVVSKDLEKKVSEAVGMDSDGVKQGQSNEDSDDELLSFPLSIIVAITVFYILGCSLIFMLFEDWDYGTSLYFTLISFTTIGFGDVLPSDYDYMILVAILLLIGLSLVSTMMNIIQQQIEALASGVKDNIDKEYMNALNDAVDDGEVHPDVLAGNEHDAENGGKPQTKQDKSLSSVISRMPIKERALYYLMPSNAKKQLEKHNEGIQGRKTRGCQTDASLLEALIREEILKMELNNDLEAFGHQPIPRHRAKYGRVVSTDVREKEVAVEVARSESDREHAI